MEALKLLPKVSFYILYPGVSRDPVTQGHAFFFIKCDLKQEMKPYLVSSFAFSDPPLCGIIAKWRDTTEVYPLYSCAMTKLVVNILNEVNCLLLPTNNEGRQFIYSVCHQLSARWSSRTVEVYPVALT